MVRAKSLKAGVLVFQLTCTWLAGPVGVGKWIEYTPPVTGLLIVTEVMVVAAPLLLACLNTAIGLPLALNVTVVLPDMVAAIVRVVTAVPTSLQLGASPDPLVINTRPAVEGDSLASVVVVLA